MDSRLFFRHPQPLSPDTRAEPDVLSGKWKLNGKYVKGVGTSQSVYYLWFEYLRRSEKYKKACANCGKGMEKLYEDFGNIFQYKSDATGFTDVRDFYFKWWKPRGSALFGTQSVRELDGFSSLAEVDALREDIENGDYKVIIVQKSMPRALMRKRLGRLVTSLKNTEVQTPSPTYEMVSDRVDAESLRNCLDIYDFMKAKERGEHKLSTVEIYDRVLGVKPEHRYLDLFTDSRSERGMLRDWVVGEPEFEDDDAPETEEFERKVDAAVAYADKKMRWREKQRIKGTNKNDIMARTRPLTGDELIALREIYYAQFMGFAVKSPQNKARAAAKNYYKQHVYRLYRKAKANIKAVERGEFGIGHRLINENER